MSSHLATVYIITGVVSVIIAFLLVYFSALSDNSKKALDKNKKRIKYLDRDISVEEPLERIIYNELANIVDSEKDCEQVTKVVSDMFNKELDKKIILHTQELSRKYESVIKEKIQNEEVAWGKYEKELVDRKQTEAVIKSIAEGLLVVDSSGNVIMMNPAAEKLLGVSKKDKIGRPVLENLREEQLISLVKNTPGSKGREIELVSQQDETKKILRASSAVIENENGYTVGMVSVLSDITKQKELDQLKSNFVSSVSHELRTPLIAIEKSITLILSNAAGPISQNQEQFLSIAERNLKRLSLLIDDLLDLSKLEAGRMDLMRELCSIENMIDESLKSFDTWASTKSIRMEKNIHGPISDLYVDPNRINQILNNLIGNAIKFTPNNGSIIIEASFDNENKEIKVIVQDTGSGIAQGDLKKVFDKFYQATGKPHSEIIGTGIGLSIAKEIVELHGGRIWAESEQNQGARFIFTLPLNTIHA
ncbi:MAG: cell wall metabolism sensor histidine kinase WalK [Candidatus Omnitrophica bacterium]|nr:cell wall metabolism sensor histidine kinase WalK [Candidatus Omnitrophota bacterium]